MAEGTHVIDVDEATFEAEVVARSSTVPVIVDFWAPWCGPCRALTPLLTAIVAEAGGKLLLAKVNTDENPELSAAFGIRGIPAVKVIKDGQIVGEFVGVQTRPYIEALLARVVPSAAAEAATEARQRLSVGDVSGALDIFRAALAADPSDAGVLLGLGEALLLAGHLDEAVETLGELREGEEGWEDAQSLLTVVGLTRAAQEAGTEAAIQARLDADADDHAARYALAGLRFMEGDPRGALEALLEIVRRRRSWGDDAARKAMLALFHRIGNRSPLADEYRTRLARTLY